MTKIRNSAEKLQNTKINVSNRKPAECVGTRYPLYEKITMHISDDQSHLCSRHCTVVTPAYCRYLPLLGLQSKQPLLIGLC